MALPLLVRGIARMEGMSSVTHFPHGKNWLFYKVKEVKPHFTPPPPKKIGLKVLLSSTLKGWGKLEDSWLVMDSPGISRRDMENSREVNRIC